VPYSFLDDIFVWVTCAVQKKNVTYIYILWLNDMNIYYDIDKKKKKPDTKIDVCE